MYCDAPMDKVLLIKNWYNLSFTWSDNCFP